MSRQLGSGPASGPADWSLLATCATAGCTLYTAVNAAAAAQSSDSALPATTDQSAAPRMQLLGWPFTDNPCYTVISDWANPVRHTQ